MPTELLALRGCHSGLLRRQELETELEEKR